METAARFSGLPALVLLDSAARDRRGRYSFLTADPFHIIRQEDGGTIRATPPRAERHVVEADPLNAVREMLLPFMQEPEPGLPPFQGGAAGFIGYAYGRSLERIPPPRRRDLNLPDLCLGLYDWVISWDHVQEQCWIISTGIPDSGAAQDRRAAARLEFVRQAIATGSREQGA
ncbi:MAG: aminodeoxychorismate synthase component I, partial [Gemmatimonadales bacterium]